MLVIFDCDGVLVDSEPLSNRALRDSLEDIGLVMTLDGTSAEFKGRSYRQVEARLAELLGRPVPPDFGDDYRARRDAAFWAHLEPVAGIEEALDTLYDEEVPTCVASSGDHEKMRLTLGLTGLYDRFEGRIYSATEVPRGKPAPDLFLHAAAQEGFAPEDCVVVEDSVPGVAAARAAGMRVLGFGEELDADMVFSDMRELPQLL